MFAGLGRCSMLCGVVWPVGLREAFLGAVLARQQAPANLAAQSVVRDPAAPASPQSLLEMWNHGLISVPLNQNHHMIKTLVIHRHVKVWELLAPLSCSKPLWLPTAFCISPIFLPWHSRHFAAGSKLTFHLHSCSHRQLEVSHDTLPQPTLTPSIPFLFLTPPGIHLPLNVQLIVSNL